ncbi:dermonecrotic toxin domain-containing protein [Pseudomonas sp. CT11-2]|uniref:dermonecrotic toxin domain-containing protein n=1 Tax=Pseudomonas sp. CT11-2 TaxID=3243023 RepID=UPI0039B0C7CF
MNELLRHVAAPHPAPSLRMRDELKAALDIALPQTPGQLGEHLIKEKWGQDIDPQTTLMVTLDYHYKGHPEENGFQQGQVASSRSLLQALLSNYQTVGDGRFAETAFGLYTPPDVGPTVRIVEHVDEFADYGSGNHDTYEGIYRQTAPQTYGPASQLKLRPVDFKKWVWELDFKHVYETYLEKVWPSDEVLTASSSYALRTSVKAAFVMTAWLQFKERCLSQKGLELAMEAAGLPPGQAWETLTIEQLQAATRPPLSVRAGRLKLYRYTATDIWAFRDTASTRMLLYIPGNSSPLHEFTDATQLHQWVVAQGKLSETKQALAAHFAEDDREDGTFHAGVLTALDGMAQYPAMHRLTNNAGFFNNDGYWDPADYIGYDNPPSATDPFAQLVLTMKQAAHASIESIRTDAQVNRDNLSAVVEPVVQWINRFGPLALFVPGGEGILALAGLIDAGYGLDQAVNGETPHERSEGVSRTVFGLLNALPIAVQAALKDEAVVESVRPSSQIAVAPTPEPPVSMLSSRVELIRGIGPTVASFSDEVLAQIGKVSVIDDDMLRLMQTGRPPTPLLADTISRFKIDQDLGAAGTPEQFNRRYAALQQSEHEWVRLFQQQYPMLPKGAIEQMLDRYGVDIQQAPDVAEVRQVFTRLDSKARQYQQHVRLNRAYEGLYLRSVASPDSDILALHSLQNLPGWPRNLRIDVLDQSVAGRVLDRIGAQEATDVRRLVRVGQHYLHQASPTDFYTALLGVLTDDDRSALLLTSPGSVDELRLAISNQALPRSQVILGLQRMDGGLPFDAHGLRGGGFPGTPQAEALTQQMMRLQLKEVYPDFTDAQADALLQREGLNAQAHIEWLKQQLQQLNTDLTGWIDQVADDIHHMGVRQLVAGDPEAAGMNAAQIQAHNIQLMLTEMHYERATRNELAEELVAIWQQRGPQQGLLLAGEQVRGVRLDLDFEDYHRLPVLNVRFNNVLELSMRSFHLTEEESLNGFLESFPNLEVLSLENVDLSHFNTNDEAGRALPPAINQLRHLTSLNLRSTSLTFSQHSASQLTDLTHLQTLDLSNNSLDVPPLVLGMNDLRRLNLSNTRINTCPVGIMEQPYLTTLDLRNNRITRVPQGVLNQAIARDRVMLQGNPLTDEDTLLRLVDHRRRTGINLWLSEPGANYGNVIEWLREGDQGLREARQLVWQRLAVRPLGSRFLRIMDGMSLTADFRVDYLALQARVWRLLGDADASEALWTQLVQDIGGAEADPENPFVLFTALEDRARFYRDWEAMGRPFPIVTQ